MHTVFVVLWLFFLELHFSYGFPLCFWQIVLEGVVGPNFLSDIGIDDVIIKDCSLGPEDQPEKTEGQIIQLIPNQNPIYQKQGLINPNPIYRYTYHHGLPVIKSLHPIFQKLNIYPKYHWAVVEINIFDGAIFLFYKALNVPLVFQSLLSMLCI